MRYIPFDKSKNILLKIAQGYDGMDRYYVEAFGIGCTDKEDKIYALLKENHGLQKSISPDIQVLCGGSIQSKPFRKLRNGHLIKH